MFAPLGEGGLILAIGAISWAIHAPLLFTSLGPTAYELVEKPESKSSRTYNIIVGHYVGLGAGFLALWILDAWKAPGVTQAGFADSARLWAAVLAVGITTLVTLALKAGQPASLATTLLVSLGAMQTAKDGVSILIGVLIIAVIGEPLRRLRLRMLQEKASQPVSPGALRSDAA